MVKKYKSENKNKKNMKKKDIKIKKSKYKIKMLKTINSLGLDILALGYSSHFFLIDSKNFKLIKHL